MAHVLSLQALRLIIFRRHITVPVSKLNKATPLAYRYFYMKQLSIMSKNLPQMLICYIGIHVPNKNLQPNSFGYEYRLTECQILPERNVLTVVLEGSSSFWAPGEIWYEAAKERGKGEGRGRRILCFMSKMEYKRTSLCTINYHKKAKVSQGTTTISNTNNCVQLSW